VEFSAINVSNHLSFVPSAARIILTLGSQLLVLDSRRWFLALLGPCGHDCFAWNFAPGRRITPVRSRRKRQKTVKFGKKRKKTAENGKLRKQCIILSLGEAKKEETHAGVTCVSCCWREKLCVT